MDGKGWGRTRKCFGTQSGEGKMGGVVKTKKKAIGRAHEKEEKRVAT